MASHVCFCWVYVSACRRGGGHFLESTTSCVTATGFMVSLDEGTSPWPSVFFFISQSIGFQGRHDVRYTHIDLLIYCRLLYALSSRWCADIPFGSMNFQVGSLPINMFRMFPVSSKTLKVLKVSPKKV